MICEDIVSSDVEDEQENQEIDNEEESQDSSLQDPANDLRFLS